MNIPSKNNGFTKGLYPSKMTGDVDREDVYVLRERARLGRIEQIVTMLIEKLRIESLAFGDGEDLQNKEVFVGLYKRENRKSRYLYLDITIDRRRYRLSTRCENKRDAEKVKYLLLSRLLKVPSTPEERESRAPTVEELSKRYLEECCRDKPSYERQAQDHTNIVRAFGNRRMDTITPEVVHRWMLQEKLRIGRYGKQIAPRTVNMDRGYLHRVFEFGRKICGLKMDNPVTNVKPLAEDNNRTRILRDEEQDVLLNACSFEWLKDVIVFTLGTGLRLGEVASLEKGWFVLNTAIPYFKVPREKGKVVTEFPIISEEVRRIVERYCRFHPERPGFFLDEKGIPVAYNRIESNFRVAARRAGFHDLWFHDLRRTFFSRLRLRGCNPTMAEYLMGHKLPPLISRYLVYDLASTAAELRKMEGSREIHVTPSTHLPEIMGQIRSGVIA